MRVLYHIHVGIINVLDYPCGSAFAHLQVADRDSKYGTIPKFFGNIGSIDEMSALDHMGLTFLRTLMWRMKELGQIQVRFVASMDFVPGIEPQEEKTGRGKGA